MSAKKRVMPKFTKPPEALTAVAHQAGLSPSAAA
jgi:hypothetical protein